MLEFKNLELDDRKIIEKYLSCDNEIMSDRSFNSLFIWKDISKIKFCIEDDFLYFAAQWDDKALYYSMPIGKGSLEEPIKNIIADASLRGGYPHIYTITKDRLEEVRNILGNDYKITPNRGFFDYVYLTENLTNLTGKKYHSKRNFINRFLAENKDNWEYQDLKATDKDEILAFFDEWIADTSADIKDFESERNALTAAMNNFSVLRITGGKLYVNNHLIAFTVASPQNSEALEIHFEKSLGIAGGYQMISHEFLKRICSNSEYAGYKYINREEDMGLAGLRKSKTSLHPLFLSEKYVAEHI